MSSTTTNGWDYVQYPTHVKVAHLRCCSCGRFQVKNTNGRCPHCGEADMSMHFVACVPKPLENVEVSFIMDPKNPDRPFSDVKVTQL